MCTHFHSSNTNNIIQAQSFTPHAHANGGSRTPQRMTATDKQFPFLEGIIPWL